MKYIRQKDRLIFYFYDDLDYMKIQSLKEEVIKIIQKENKKIVEFDFRNVNFVDSTGIGFVLARYRDLHKNKKELILSNLSKENKVIFEMSGIFSIIRYKDDGVKL